MIIMLSLEMLASTSESRRAGLSLQLQTFTCLWAATTRRASQPVDVVVVVVVHVKVEGDEQKLIEFRRWQEEGRPAPC